MTFVYVTGYLVLALLVVIMARLKRISSGNGYFGIFLCAVIFTPIPAFFLVMLMRPRGKPVAESPTEGRTSAP